MGTYATISTSELSDDTKKLFNEHLCENTCPHSDFFQGTVKFMSFQSLVDGFACAIEQIATAMTGAKIHVSVLGSELDQPILVAIGPKSIEVISASENDREHILAYADFKEEPQPDPDQASAAEAGTPVLHPSAWLHLPS